jgi:opacity protein-like surface antigen
MARTTLNAALAACLLQAPMALAQWPQLTFSGYGTLGAVHSDNDQADYLVDAFKPNGPGRSRDVSWDVDSRLGLQASARFTPQLNAVVQVIAQQRHDNRWRPVLEWANLRYELTPDIAVRVGREVLPVYMVTDSRRVGYGNPWVRPPVEVYSLVPVTSVDGGDISWRHAIGGGNNTLQLTLGRAEADFPDASGFDAGTAEARNLVSVVNTFEAGPLTIRGSYGEARLTIAAYRDVFGAFRQFGPPGEAIYDRYVPDNRRITFIGVGATYDTGPWFVTGEYARFNTRSIVGHRRAMYVSGGARLGAFTPYATFARVDSESDTSAAGLPVAAYPAPLQPTAALLNAGLNAQLNALPRQATVSAGVRWDFMRNAAFKLQYDQVDLDSGSFGTFGNVQPGFTLGGKVRVLSAAIDFVF